MRNYLRKLMIIVAIGLPLVAKGESDRWWRQFNDTTLSGLIRVAIDNNYNVQSAVQRIEMARQVMRAGRSSWYPQLQMNAGWDNMQESGMNVRHSGNPERDEYFTLGLSMSWEVDLFGKIAKQVKADKYSYEATAAEYDGVILSLCSNLAKSYISLRVTQSVIALTEEDLQSQEDLLKLAETRYECGLVPQLDVVQGRVTIQNTQRSLVTLKSNVKNSINSIALLCGVYSNQLAYLNDTVSLPSMPPINAECVPADLLRRRPDVAEAEKTVEQYMAMAGVAKKDWLPTLTIAGSIGTSAHILGNLFSKNSFTWDVAPTLSWTLFDGMGREARIASAKARLQEEIEQYNETLMTAVEETQNALVSLETAATLTSLLQGEEKNYNRILEMQTDRYRQGLCDFSDVLTAQQNCLNNRTSIVQSQGNELSAAVTLYTAVGGEF